MGSSCCHTANNAVAVEECSGYFGVAVAFDAAADDELVAVTVDAFAGDVMMIAVDDSALSSDKRSWYCCCLNFGRKTGSHFAYYHCSLNWKYRTGC